MQIIFPGIKTTKKEVEPSKFYVDDVPYCCTARFFYGFSVYDTEEGIIARCNQVIPSLDNEGFGLVYAITTDEQKQANSAFERMGFYTNPTPIKKDRNAYSGDLHIWFMPVKEFTPIEL